MVRLDYPTVICTVFTSYLTGLTNRNELIPDILISITNAYYAYSCTKKAIPTRRKKIIILNIDKASGKIWSIILVTE